MLLLYFLENFNSTDSWITWEFSGNSFVFLDQKAILKIQSEKTFQCLSEEFLFLNNNRNNRSISWEYRVSKTSFVGVWKDTVELQVILQRAGCTEKGSVDYSYR